jgi:p-cumate 2,3-dioxygenase subunit beta
MSDKLLLKDEIESFLYREADYCDNWELQQWIDLWADGEILYQVGPLATPDAEQLDPKDILYLINDNRFRLEQRVIRMLKPTAHAEWPVRSRLRHTYSNFRDIKQDTDSISLKVNMLVARTREDTRGVAMIPGYIKLKLERQNDGELKLREKRIFVDLHVLSKPGTMSIII